TYRSGITGTTRQKHAFWILVEDFSSTRGCGHYGQIAAGVDETSKDVAFGAEVERDDLVSWVGVDAARTIDGSVSLERACPVGAPLVEVVRLLGSHAAHQVETFHGGGGTRGGDQLVFISRANRSVLRTLVA